jgi:hypothetical protein
MTLGTLETVTFIGLTTPIPGETLIKAQLSLIQREEEGAVNPTTAVKEVSTVPMLDPSNVTEYDPTTDPKSGIADETVGEK